MIDSNLPERKEKRNQALYHLMKNGNWYTLEEVARLTGYPSATASAGIRDFRKKEFGNNTINKNYLGEGVYQYQFIKNPDNRIIEEKYK